MKKYTLFMLMGCWCTPIFTQSFELMPGFERLFIDAQYLRPFDTRYRWTLFVRARVTKEYGENVNNLFLGNYLSYTTKSGFGGTFLGRISSASSGFDIGPHFTKTTDSFTIFALPYVNLGDEGIYGWFSIIRLTPNLTDVWKLYSSLELFSNLNKEGHVISIQRTRIGLDREGYQFGLALNLSQFGIKGEIKDDNFGVFVRKQF